MARETQKEHRDPEYERLLERERLILAATELVYELMEKQNVSKAELARRVDRTRGYLTQLLDGNRNMTLRTLADLAHALDCRIELQAQRHRSRAPATREPKLIHLDSYRGVRTSDRQRMSGSSWRRVASRTSSPDPSKLSGTREDEQVALGS